MSLINFSLIMRKPDFCICEKQGRRSALLFKFKVIFKKVVSKGWCKESRCIFDDNEEICFANFFIKTYVVDAHKNHLAKVIVMSTHNIGFYEDLTKIIFHLSLIIIKNALYLIL